MKIDNLLRITDGVLQNIPSVDYIESIKISPKNIKRGDLFLDTSNSKQDRSEAIKNGAYAIITEHIDEISDKEIAWIEVDSLRLASIKLARYEFIKKNCKLLYLNDIESDIFSSIVKNRKYKKLPNDAFDTLIILNKSENGTKFVCSDKRLSFSIAPTAQELKECYNINGITSKSPFYSSFICEERFYENIKIPSIFIERLCLVLKYLDEEEIDYNLNGLNLKNHFGAIFVDYEFTKKEFGQGEKVLIFENNPDYINKELIFLKKFYPATSLYSHPKFKNFINEFENVKIFESFEELKKSIRKNSVKYNLIISDYNEGLNMVNHKKREQLTLF